MKNFPDDPNNLSLCISRFNDILISAATTHVRKSKPSRKSNPWINPHVRAKIRTRNRLHRTIHQNRQEWIYACCEATEAINEAKTESWKNLLQGAMSNSDDPNMCKVIQSLNGTPEANSPNEAMSHDGRTITDIKSKANIFINHYARVSKLNMSHIDRDINQQFKKGISAPSADNKSCAPLEMGELLSAIKKMKGKRAAGPDNIPPSFLKSLGPLALQELLSTPGVTTVKTRGRTFASSLEEEAAAMESALSWTSTNANHPSISVLFCKDSKSLCEAIISSNPRTFSIHNSINSISSSIFIQWIPGHSAIPGNNLADKAAKEATTIAADTILPVSFSSSVQVINETIRDALPTHEHVALVYQHRRVSRDAKQISNRKDNVLLARLRSGQHPSLRQYLNRLDPSEDLICPNFHFEVQDLLHWLCECPTLMTIRQRVSGNHQGSLE